MVCHTATSQVAVYHAAFQPSNYLLHNQPEEYWSTIHHHLVSFHKANRQVALCHIGHKEGSGVLDIPLQVIDLSTSTGLVLLTLNPNKPGTTCRITDRVEVKVDLTF